ncbi:MAG: hypothetical protein MZU97_17465 [Bacillus subtilis]|nr:hypothetical protein [Bacillus subtilis]
MFTFEAFDEPWKGSANPVEPEKHWGSVLCRPHAKAIHEASTGGEEIRDEQRSKIGVGTIVNTHGLKGELRILPDTDFQSVPLRSKAKRLCDRIRRYPDRVPVKIATGRITKASICLLFEGYEDINLVERWKTCAGCWPTTNCRFKLRPKTNFTSTICSG